MEAALLMGEPLCLSVAEIARLNDAQIYGLLLCPRDKDGNPDWSAYKGSGVASEVPLPSAEDLRIPPEAFEVAHVSKESGQPITPPVSYVLTWWWVWRGRQERDGWSDDELMAKWRECVARGR
jgi:hypothetical protein